VPQSRVLYPGNLRLLKKILGTVFTGPLRNLKVAVLVVLLLSTRMYGIVTFADNYDATMMSRRQRNV